MKYRLNIGIMVMVRMARPWPDSPISILVLSDSEKKLGDGITPLPVVNEKLSINVYSKVNNVVTSKSKYLEDWYLPNKDTHPEDVETHQDILHYLDFTGYCYKEKTSVPDRLPTLIVISNDVLVDRNLWEQISLENLKSLVAINSTELQCNLG